MKQISKVAAMLATGALSLSCAPRASAQSLNLQLLTNLDVSSAFTNGLNPSAVAWNGTDAYLAGSNGNVAAQNTGIVRVADVLGATTIGTAFGALNTANGRGFTGLALTGNSLAAAYDSGVNEFNSYRGFDISDPTNPTQAWNLSVANVSARGTGGAAVDPGFNGNGGGFGGLFLGSGFERTFNPTTGAAVTNMNVNTNPVSTTWRDIAFDSTNGDFYARENNRLVKGIRTASNAVTQPTTVIGSLAVGANINNQNLAFINTGGVNSLLIVNDRTAVGGSQAFTNVVKAFDTSGGALAINFSGGFVPADGNAAYDFYFHSGTQTLAISDFSNRRLYVFGVTASVAPEPGTFVLAALGFGTLAIVYRRRRGTK